MIKGSALSLLIVESAKDFIFSVTDNGPELLKKIKEEYSIRFNH
jgi:hypothetical protein